MYFGTSRLQYNLQCVGVFQKARSDKNIQAEACRYIIPQKYEQFKQKAYIRTPKAVLTIGFQDWIVPLPGVHGSSLCIPNFTAKKDKKELKWTVFGKNARKLCEKGKNPKKI